MGTETMVMAVGSSVPTGSEKLRVSTPVFMFRSKPVRTGGVMSDTSTVTTFPGKISRTGSFQLPLMSLTVVGVSRM